MGRPVSDCLILFRAKSNVAVELGLGSHDCLSCEDLTVVKFVYTLILRKDVPPALAPRVSLENAF